MTHRRKARLLALQLLYAFDTSPINGKEVEELFWEGRKAEQKIKDFAQRLVKGARENIADIDRLISQHLDNWQFERLSTVDRNILRFATYELLYCEDIPPVVSIDEAIELAKTYSTADSPAFVNGILDKIRKVIDAG
ncbi:TPA: transcription antitermination factor NusB [bacterium]|nr:transcription antitermination factor NusB [bacterium]